MTKEQRHRFEAARARREADRMVSMARAALVAGNKASASLLTLAAGQRAKAAAAHEQALVAEIQLAQRNKAA